jgi:hypothetical protein
MPTERRSILKMLNLISRLNQMPETWLCCLTILLFPLFTGAGVKLASTEALSYSNGNTQIALGKTVAQSDQLIAQQNEQINRLTESIHKAQLAAKKRKLRLPELKTIDEIAQETVGLSDDLVDKNEELQGLIDGDTSDE